MDGTGHPPGPSRRNNPWAIAAASLSAWLFPALALAQDFQPYDGKEGASTVSAPLFVVLAYSLIWLVLLVFVASVWRRQRRVDSELEQLRRELAIPGNPAHPTKD